MPSGLVNVRHLFGGGLATDFGLSAEVGIGRDHTLPIPWLVRADNLIFNLQGGPLKMGGTTKVNSVVLESGAAVRGLFDYWTQGAVGSPVQRRIIHVGTKVKRDLADGTFVDIITGLSATSLPHYHTFDDLCIIHSDGHVPYSYDGTAAAAIAGAPDGSFGCQHQGRDWMAGDPANPSTVYYSVAFDPLDWLGAGSGAIQVSPNDGDKITAMISHKNELWIFKGPNKGSIHRIVGSAPTGSDAFALRHWVPTGLGCIGPNALFPYLDDVGFVWNDGTVYSLKATAAFGDFTSGALSLPINKYLRAHINPSRANRIWCAVSDQLGAMRMGIPIDSSATINQVLWMDYRFDPPRWSRQPAIGSQCQCIARVIDTGGSGLDEMLAGGSDGFVRRLDRSAASIDGSSAIAYGWETPRLAYGDPIRRKTLHGVSVAAESTGDYDVSFGWVRDLEPAQIFSINLAGAGDVLAPAAPGGTPFMLDVSQLGGAGMIERFATLEDGGEFSSISYSFDQVGLSETIEIAGFTVALKIGAESMENT